MSKHQSSQPGNLGGLRKWVGKVSTGIFRFRGVAKPIDVSQLEEVKAEVIEIPKLSFKEFVAKVKPDFIWYWHCDKIQTQLERIIDGDLRRLLVLLPPRHTKTELVTQLFNAYYLYRRPNHTVAVASYGSRLANTISKKIREYARLGEVQLASYAVSEWDTKAGGKFWSTGVGGSGTGFGYNLGTCDDPVKNAQDAASATKGITVKEWWSSVWSIRAAPDAAQIVVMTRWPGEGDIVGWLFEQEKESTVPERWHVIALEAIKTAEPYEIPPTCTLEPDEREVGAALCTARYPISRLLQIKEKSEFFFRSLFQQRISERDGNMFKWDWWVDANVTPTCTNYVRYWDLAGTEPSKKGSDPDYTASVLGGRMHDHRTALLDMTAFRKSIHERNADIIEIAKADVSKYGFHVVWWIEQDTAVGGTERMIELLRLIQNTGLVVNQEVAKINKLLRAEPLANAAGLKNVVLGPDHPDNVWRVAFKRHMSAFSATCAHDDIADAASGCYNKLAGDDPAWTTTSASW